MTLDAMLAAAAAEPALLDDPARRAILSDALEEAGRDAEARLLRGAESVAVVRWADRVGVESWQMAASYGTARCTLAEWLRDGAEVVRMFHGVRRVLVSDKRPDIGADGLARWYSLPGPRWLASRGFSLGSAPQSAVIHAVFGVELPTVHTYVDGDDAVRVLSAQCLTWAQLRALEPLLPGARGVAPAPRRQRYSAAEVIRVADAMPRSLVRLMLLLQLHAGMRPAEVRLMRWSEIDRTGEVWTFTPAAHKNAWRDQDRTVMLGPKAQALLLRAGVPITTVAQRLGHADAAITLRHYAHCVPGDQERAAEVTARLFGCPGKSDTGI